MRTLQFLQCFTDKTGGNKKYKATDYLPEGRLPIIDQGKKFIGGYTDNIEDKYKGELPCVVFGDHSREIKYVDFDFALGADGVKVLEVNRDVLIPKFAYYYLQTVELPEAGYDRSFKYLKRIDVPVLDLQTQTQIVAALDKAKLLIDKRQESIELLDELLQATFLDMFGDPYLNPKNWKKEKLENLVGSDCPLTYGIVQPGDEYSDGIPVVRPVDLIQPIIGLKGLKRIDPKISEKFKRTILNGGEILLSVRGTTGTLSIASAELKGANVTRGITPIWFDQKYNTKFAISLFRSKGVQTSIERKTYGAALKQINLSDVRKLELIVPPSDLQNEFGKLAEEIDKLHSKIENSLVKAQYLFQSLLQRAFHGDLSFDIDLQLDAFLSNEDFEAIAKDDVFIQRLIDRFNQHNHQNGEAFEGEKSFKFTSSEDYERAKKILFNLMKVNKVGQVYDKVAKKTTIEML